MAFTDLQSFLQLLEKEGELHRVTEEVDPELEVTEIATRAVKEKLPALLFENVKGSKYPLVINSMATLRRIELALGRPAEALGEDIVRFMEDVNPPNIGSFWRNRKTGWRLLKIRPKTTRRAMVQQVVEEPRLDELPILKCWPEDGGRFVTLPLVMSKDPQTGAGNMGMYRMQVYDPQTTGMHMQIQKGGGFHYQKAEKMGQPLEMAVAVGGDPSLILGAIMPLPEGLDEVAFSGIVRGQRTPLTKAKSIDMKVPAHAEFVFEGILQPRVRRVEGPFGDHFGHYSASGEHPVFEIKRVTHRKNAIYPATVVGRPPQEDRYLGDAAQLALTPLVRLIRREVKDMWAYYEAGFHNLLVVSVDPRYQREPIKTALGILGDGQLSLTKNLVLVGPDVNPRDYSQVMQAIRRNFDPEQDFHLIARTAADTLDFTGEALHKGSKMILDATGGPLGDGAPSAVALPANIGAIAPGITKHRLVGKTMLVVQTSGSGREAVQKLVDNPLLGSVKIVVAISEDVDIHDNENLIWGIFTRFDAVLDVIFSRSEFHGLAPVYSGVLGIDATWKEGYQKPLVMDPEIVKKVDSKWYQYWK
ncbi:MAG TPA: 4-hydroxybenzoate decarboxylase [Dehalococcoidia bacterium]|nr:4-hydroxybenzoate decarboxylase [Dehalococcoidia bacterium]